MGLIGGDFRRKSGIGGGDLCFFRSSNDGKSLGGGSIGSLDCWPLFFGLMFETCDRGGFCFESWSCSHFGTNILDKTENGSLLLEAGGGGGVFGWLFGTGIFNKIGGA